MDAEAQVALKRFYQRARAVANNDSLRAEVERDHLTLRTALATNDDQYQRGYQAAMNDAVDQIALWLVEPRKGAFSGR